MTYPMVEDPAATLPSTAYSAQATAVLERIVATPRHDTATRRPASLKRIAVGGLVAAAATTVALAAPMPWNGGHPSEAAAYTVDRHRDASVSVVVHWNQLSDPAALQRALDEAGAPVRVLTGSSGTGDASPAGVPGCAKPYYGNPYSADAVSWDSGRNAPDSSFVVHPAAFPEDGTLVIEVFFVPGSHQWASMLSFMAIGRVPTCAVHVGASH
jgi:hypothetical protein